MPLGSLALVVLAACLHATWNLLAKRASASPVVFVFAYSVIASIAYAPLALWVMFERMGPWTLAALGFVVASGLLHVAYSLALQRGYAVADLSVVYPVARGTSPMLSALAAFVLLREAATPLRLAGIAAILLGIVLISGLWRRGLLVAGDARGVRWGLLIGLMSASYTVVDASAVKLGGVHPVILDWGANLVRVALLAPLVPREGGLGSMTGNWRLAAGVGLLAPLGYMLVLTALAGGLPLSVVGPVRELSMMAGTLLAVLVLKERLDRWRLLGCGAMIGGVVLLGAS